jgi:uncharacterized protein YndB with AHSA1/START domain
MTNEGTLETRADGRSHLRFERRIGHPVDRVWAALTEPDRIRQWLASADELDLREGGAVVLRWLNTDDEGNTAIARGTVSVVDPPRVLEFDTDIHGVLRWELQPAGDDATSLTFTATVKLPEDFKTEVMSGWHVHLDFLEDALDGKPIEDWDNWPRDRWDAIHERYSAVIS